MASLCDVTVQPDFTNACTPMVKSWKKPYELPPCKVCGRKGTGFHYGVNTCEPCKVFFRLAQMQDTPFECKRDARCNIFLGRRNMCPCCRYQRCLQVGMSRAGIKNGRYSADKKLQDLVELRKQKTLETALFAILEEERLRPSVEKFVTSIVDARNTHAHIWNEHQKEQCYRDLTYVKMNKVNLLSDTLNHVQLVNTGLSETDKMARKMIKYIKCLPGFKDLCVEDQVALCQVSLFDVVRVNMYQVAQEMARSGDFSLMEVQLMYGAEMGTTVVTMCQRLLNLDLKLEEVALLGAMLLFSTYGCKLKEPRKVESVHYQLVEALQWLLKRNHPEDKLKFPKVVAVMTEMRSLASMTNDYHRTLIGLADEGHIQVSPLMRQLVPPLE